VRIPLVQARPARPLAGRRAERAVIATGAVGYLDAAEEDQRRWIAGFRALLDGLDAPLQAVIQFVPGRGHSTVEEPGGELPEPGRRRERDIAFATALREATDAQRREVFLATRPAAADHLERVLREMRVPNVRRVEMEAREGQLVGTETPRTVHDGEGHHRTWCLDRFPGGELVAGWLLRLVPPGLRVSLSWHAERLPTAWVVDYLQRQLVHLRASQLYREGGVGDPLVDGAAPAAEALQQRLTASQESAFHVALYLTLTAQSPEELDAGGEQVEAAARAALCRLLPCTFRQLDGRLATLPSGRDPLGRCRVLDTSALSTLFPWFESDLQEADGLVVGRHRATGQPIVVDPFDHTRYQNSNIGVFGHSGAGKTYLLSTLALGALGLGAQVFVIDPEHEYGGLARELGGLDVTLALGSGHSINILDLRGSVRDEATLGPAVADAVDLCSVICGGLDEPELAALEAAVRATFDSVALPVLGDVAERLPSGSRAARVLSRWVQGSLGQIFSRPTSIDLEAQLVVFGMRELRPEMVAPVHYLLAEALWARIKTRDRRRLLVIDELGLLFEDPTVRRFVVSLARRIRKYNGSLVFATQNPGDLLSTESGAVVATNPALHFFGAQRPGEAAKLQATFQLSDAQRAGLEAARRGDFLLAAAADRLAVRVQAPPWQAAAMEKARAPPFVQSTHMGAPRAQVLLTGDRLHVEWPEMVACTELVARCKHEEGEIHEARSWARVPDSRDRYRATCGPLRVDLELQPRDRCVRMRCEVTADEQVDVREVSVATEVRLADTDLAWILYNGYQSWDAAGYLAAGSARRESWWTIGVADASGRGLALAAAQARSCCTMFTIAGGELSTTWCEAESIERRPSLFGGPAGTRWTSEETLLAAGDDVRARLDELVPQTARATEPPLLGWVSWYHYGPWVTRDDVLTHADLLAAESWRRLGYRLVLLDDGWQQAYGEWTPNTKFPGGLPPLCEELRRRGQVAGIWIAPFLVSPSADVASEAPDDWFVTDPTTGERAIDSRHRAFGPMYVLDASNPAVQAHLRDVFAQLYEAGIRFFKVDFLYAGGYAGLPALLAGLEAIREGAGDGYIVASGAPLLAVVGLVEACRVGQDTATPIYDFDTAVSTPTIFGNEVLAVARNVAARSYLDRWFHLDPDVALVGGNLTLEQGRQLATMAALAGGPFLASDDLLHLPPERLELLTNPEVLELVGQGPAVPDWEPNAGDHPPVHWRRGDVLAVFNWAPVDREIEVRAPGAQGARDLWARSEMADFRHGTLVPVPGNGVRLLRLR
jgi:Melibiase/Helicase HerA, central domain